MTGFDLNDFTKNPDGTFSKKKTQLQPRDIVKQQWDKTLLSKVRRNGQVESIANKIVMNGVVINKNNKGIYSIDYPHKLTLKLFGIPMPKQSVRSTTTGHHFQPKKTVDRSKDYKRQIKEQLPKDFIPFMHEVHVRKFHCIYPPLKAFHKKKGKMEAIRNGEIFYKNTQPDLMDNLKKLVFDCLGKDKKTGVPLVLGNDGIVVTENDTAKYYGLGGAIIIELEGY